MREEHKLLYGTDQPVCTLDRIIKVVNDGNLIAIIYEAEHCVGAYSTMLTFERSCLLQSFRISSHDIAEPSVRLTKTGTRQQLTDETNTASDEDISWNTCRFK